MLDLGITVADDMRDNYQFFTVRMLHVSGNIPACFYGSILSEFLGIAKSEEIITNILDHESNRLVASDQYCWGAIDITAILILNPRNSCHDY